MKKVTQVINCLFFTSLNHIKTVFFTEATEKLTTTNSDQKKSLPIRLKIPKPEILAEKVSKEDEKEDSGDIQSYMDKSSSRIKTLLNLAADEDKDAVDFPTDGYPSESAAASVQKYYEEQSGDSLEAVTADSSISSDVESNSGNSWLIFPKCKLY